MFESAKLLKDLSTNKKDHFVTHSGISWQVNFSWFALASLDDIRKIEKKLKITFPQDYKIFLSEISNGASLFEDYLRGQSGIRVYGLSELIKKQEYWKNYFEDAWESSYLAFADVIGESTVLFFDVNQVSYDKISNYIYNADLNEDKSEWTRCTRTFHDFIDFFISAQGELFWRWY